ncbi:MAG TPA: hypothetical protein PK625_10905, partial [Spirochaetales bacterium]|nr:hypothetical protein [Spirochaetales bacterium]
RAAVRFPADMDALPLRIGMIDSSVDLDHPALAQSHIQSRSFASEGAILPSYHGTAIASIIAADSADFVGIAPNSEVFAAAVFEQDPQRGEIASTVSLVRALRSEFGIAPERKLKVAVRPDAGPDAEFLGRNADLVALLCNAESVSFVNDKPAGALALAGRGFDCYVFAREAVDTAQLAARFRKEADKERQFAQKVAAKLANPGFTDSAPAEVVGKERDKLQAAQARAGRLENYLKDLE